MSRHVGKANSKSVAHKQGPTSFEILYLAQLKRELETFLKGHEFDTINKIALSINGHDYSTSMTVTK